MKKRLDTQKTPPKGKKKESYWGKESKKGEKKQNPKTSEARKNVVSQSKLVPSEGKKTEKKQQRKIREKKRPEGTSPLGGNATNSGSPIVA